MGGYCEEAVLIYILEFNEAVKDLFLSIEPNLRNWRERNRTPLPEDICLFKTGDLHPTLLSALHEGRAWLLTNANPGLKGVSFSKTVRVENLDREFFISREKHFCKVWRGKQE